MGKRRIIELGDKPLLLQTQSLDINDQRQYRLLVGGESVNNVLRALRGAKSKRIVKIWPSSAYGAFDNEGADIVVDFEKSHPIPRVTIEVKSNDEDVENYRMKISGRENIPLQGVDEWMLGKCHMIINGRESEAAVRKIFFTNLNEILKFNAA